ncbi:MAG: hypothetical protein EOO24_35585 [Comamonadaceae bacterium]|nr:MAG: hypothetical protein EOO24_35585 [Comamonadaceae bacterium]
MRMVFGVLSLLFVVAVIGFLAKKQLGAVTAPPAAVQGASPGASTPARATPQQQVDQFQKALEGAVQQARPMPDEK